MIPQAIWERMLSHVQSQIPLEACGLLGGKEGAVTIHYPVENAALSAVRFRMAPQAQLDAFLSIDASGNELIAIYHSHPAGAAYPSETDLDEHAYPGVVQIILAISNGKWTAAAFLLDDRQVNPVALEIIET